MKKVKPTTTYKQQVEILKSRNLLFEDERLAEEYLEYANYYRLRGYYIHLQKPNSDEFIDGVSFNQIASLHDFDNELRVLLLKLLLDIEISFRTKIAYTIGHNWGPMGYRDENNYSEQDYEKCVALIESIDKNLEKSHELFIYTHIEKYDGQFPIWVAVEVMSFGELSKLYRLLPKELKKEIAKCYDGLDESLLTNWIQCSAMLRNLCAHNSRIYARSIPTPIVIKNDVQKSISKITKGRFNVFPQTLFSYLLAIKDISRKEIWNCFVDELEKLFDKYEDSIQLVRLGMPYQWKSFLNKK